MSGITDEQRMEAHTLKIRAEIRGNRSIHNPDDWYVKHGIELKAGSIVRVVADSALYDRDYDSEFRVKSIHLGRMGRFVVHIQHVVAPIDGYACPISELLPVLDPTVKINQSRLDWLKLNHPDAYEGFVGGDYQYSNDYLNSFKVEGE